MTDTTVRALRHITPWTYEWPQQRMTSGIADQQKFKYHAYKHKNHHREDYWYLVADTPNAGDYCYCGSSDPVNRSQGFGGRAMEFPIEGHEEGRIITLYGPWHSSSQAILGATGVDYTRRHLTRGIIAEEKTPGKMFMCDTYSKIVHLDEEPVIGAFARIKVATEWLVKEYGVPLYYQVQSNGGGQSSRILPNTVEGKS